MTKRHDSIAPMHPGELLREDYLPELKEAGLSMSGLARNLGISRASLYDLIEERRAVTAEMAVRFAKAFGTSPEFWLNLQTAYDVWQARQAVDVSGIRSVAVSQ